VTLRALPLQDGGGDRAQVGANDVGAWGERIEHLTGPRHEGGGASSAHGARDIPGVRGHEADLADRRA